VFTGSSQTTLFDDDGDGAGDAFTATDEDRLTYIVFIADGDNPGTNLCYVWGDDPSYYDSSSCEEL
jgi:hypothetical protein